MRQDLDARLDTADDPEDPKTVYDIIARENPNNDMLIKCRAANPGIFGT